MAGFRGLFVRKTTVGTQTDEARKALAGLLVPSSVLGARQGILPAPGDPLRVTGTASWQYSVNAGHVVTSRSDSDGAMLFGSDGTTLTPAVAAAPGSGSRYDLIYVRHLDPDQGEGDPSVVVGVVSGTASGTPVKPAVPAGAVVVAEALMAAGATSTQHANVTITQVLPPTVARGGILPVANAAEREALAKWPGLTVYRIDTGMIESTDGTSFPGKMPRGHMAFGAVVGTNGVQLEPTARLQATGVTPEAGRIVNIRAAVHVYNPGTGVFVSGRITRDGTQVGNYTQVWHPGGGQVIRVAHEADDQGPTAAAHTYEYRLWTTSGGLTYDAADASMRVTDDGGV